MYYFNGDVLKSLASEDIFLTPEEVQAYVRACNYAQSNDKEYKTKKNGDANRPYSVWHAPISDSDAKLTHWLMLPGKKNWITKDPTEKFTTTKLFLNLVTGEKKVVKIRRPVTKLSATHILESLDEANNNRLMKVTIQHYLRYSLAKGTKAYLFQPYRGQFNLLDFLENPNTTSKALLNMLVNSGMLLEKMHLKGYLHTDFKPQNVVISDDGKSVTLLDLEFMMDKASGEKGKNRLQGTKTYIHPDWLDHSLLSRQNGQLVYYSTKNDTYSFLITAIAFLTKAYDRAPQQSIKEKIQKCLGQLTLWKQGSFESLPQMQEVLTQLRNINMSSTQDVQQSFKNKSTMKP